MINRDEISKSIAMIRHFIDDSLALSFENNSLTGFQLSEPLLDAAVYNTYIETVGNKADILYLNIKNGLNEMITHSYLQFIKRISSRFDWKSKHIMLALDYTDEDFYGEVQGLDIHGWKKGESITGHFKIISPEIHLHH